MYVISIPLVQDLIAKMASLTARMNNHSGVLSEHSAAAPLLPYASLSRSLAYVDNASVEDSQRAAVGAGSVRSAGPGPVPSRMNDVD